MARLQATQQRNELKTLINLVVFKRLTAYSDYKSYHVYNAINKNML